MSSKRPLYVRLILQERARMAILNLFGGLVFGLLYTFLEPVFGVISAGLACGVLGFGVGAVGAEVDYYYVAPLLRRLYSDRPS